MKILKKIKKSILLTATLMLITSMAFISQSCNSNGNEFVDIPDSSSLNQKTNTRLANSRTLIIDSISESDEFLDFGISCKLLSEKVQVYTTTLSKEELEELMNNLNNDDYMDIFVHKANIKNELSIVTKAKKELEESNFSILSSKEATNLFLDFSESSLDVTMKTRGEGTAENECRKRYDEDYKNNTVVYLAAVAACACGGPVAGCLCVAAASAAYSVAMKSANRDYQDCMKNATN